MSLKYNVIQRIKEKVVDNINRTNSIFPIAKLVRKVNDIIRTRSFKKPSLKPTLLKRFQEPPSDVIAVHNENTSNIKADVDIINSTINELHIKQTLSSILRNNMSKIINHLFNKVKENIKALRRNYFIDVQTIKDDFSTTDNIDSLSGAVVDTESGILTLQQPLSPVSSVTSEDGVVNVDVLNNITFVSPRNEGDLLNVTNDNLIQFIASTNERESVTYQVKITFPNRPVNQVAIKMDNRMPLQTTLKVNGRIKKQDYVILKGTYLFSFKSVSKANTIELTMKANNEDFVRNGLYIYNLNLIHINIRNAARNLSGTVISRPLTFNDPITEIALKSDEQKPARTSIKYYVADMNNPNNWIRLRPSHSMFDKQNWISIGEKSEFNKIIEVDHRIPPTDNSGNSVLYNILDNITEEGISSGKIDISDDWKIDPRKSKLHMGIDDYVISEDYLKVKTKSKITAYKFPINSNGYIDMVTSINQETHRVKDNKITLTYTPGDSELLITDKDDIYSSYSIYNKQITINNITNGITVYVTYRTKLSDIESTDNRSLEIIPNSIKVRTAPSLDPISFDETITLLKDEKKVAIKPNASVSPDTTGDYYVLYISFDYYTKTKEKYKLFKTNVLYETPADTGILPFTDNEISSGNIHAIDGIDVSKYTSYHMERGWHTVVTTHPFPSNVDNSNDNNSLTGNPSDAGIILNKYDKMYAYKDPMRYVTLHRLSNIVSKNDHRSFTIDEDGRVLINFSPDVLIEPTMNGEILTGRSVKWHNRNVKSYTLLYPKFELHIVMKPTSDNTDAVQSIKYKVEIERNATAVAPVISSMELYGV